MKNNKYILALTACLILAMSSCGNAFLDTDYNQGIVDNDALVNTSNIDVALNGDYFDLNYYKFGGNYAISLGDVATDLASNTWKNNHMATIQQYSFTEDDEYLMGIWQYGYKVVNYSATIIEAINKIRPTQLPKDQKQLTLFEAEAYGLRGISYLYLANIFALPYKVNNGVDNGGQPGIVVEDQPIHEGDFVERTTIKDTYAHIIADLNKSLEIFGQVAKQGTSERGMNRVNSAAVHGYLARTYLYMQEYAKAKEHAAKALQLSKATIVTDSAAYRNMYETLATDGGETIFASYMDPAHNWSSSSAGTFWTSYGIRPGGTLTKLLEPSDIRYFFLDLDVPGNSTGGKYIGSPSKNPSASTQRLLGAAEMWLIMAECDLKTGSLNDARNELFQVAQRNHKYTSPADLPSDLFAFLQDERARELYQEGHRFQDCRRWAKKISVYQLDADNPDKYAYNGYDVSKFCFPIPSMEINTGMGVKQTDNWAAQMPANQVGK